MWFIDICSKLIWRKKEGNVYLTTLSTHFNTLIWRRTYDNGPFIYRERKPAAATTWATLSYKQQGFFKYAPPHREGSTYHGLCYTSRGTLAEMRNSSMGPSWTINMTINRTMSERFYHWTTCRSNLIWSRKEEHVVVNDTLNTFYIWLYDIWHMIKKHSDSERGNQLPPLQGQLLRLVTRYPFYLHHPTNNIVYTTTFVIPIVVHWLEREIAKWVHHEGSIQQSIATWSVDNSVDYSLVFDH